MARKVRLTYPTQVVTRMIDAGDIPLGDSAPVTVKLLDAAGGEGFELGRDSITAHLAKAPGLVADLGDDATRRSRPSRRCTASTRSRRATRR